MLRNFIKDRLLSYCEALSNVVLPCSYRRPFNSVCVFVVEGVYSVQPEAYEFKIGDRVFRRPGDPPLDQVIEMLQKHKDKSQDEI